MSAQLLEIEPHELSFTFELKKQSSCAIHLANISDQNVAFKVKTTSPKKYCVRPNIGIINPKSTCDFTVTMQAQRSAPSDIQCRDKFLIQSTIVPFGTTEDDITPGMFTKDNGKYIEEIKLRVILISPPNSPVLLPLNGDLKHEPSHESSVQKDKLKSGVENLPLFDMIAKVVEDVKNTKDVVELRPTKDVEWRQGNIVDELELSTVEDVELSPVKVVEPIPIVDVEGNKMKLGKDIEELKLKLNVLNTELCKAVLRSKSDARKVQVGFPFLFVCMVGLISLALGHLLHP